MAAKKSSGKPKIEKCLVCGKKIADVVYYPVYFSDGEFDTSYSRKDFPFCSIECLELSREVFQKRRKAKNEPDSGK